jgi:hypothetical protein
VGGVEVAKVVSRNLLDVVAVSLNGLAHHVLSVNIEMAVLNCSFQVAVVVVFMLLSNLLFNELEFVGVKSAVSDNISKKLDSLANITLGDLERNLSVLSVSSAWETSTHTVSLVDEGFIGEIVLEGLLYSIVRIILNVRGYLSFSVFDQPSGDLVHVDGGSLVASSLSGNSDTIWESCDLYL